MNASLSAPALADLGPRPVAYQRLQAQLGQTSWICHGTLVARPLVRQVRGRKIQKGPYYLWTSKVKGRTVSVALSKTQYRLLAQAIANHRQLQKTLERMHAFTLRMVLKKVPGVRKRK
jgi:hypothetical protein